MSTETLSIGNELKDSFKTTDKWISNGIEWLGSVDEFYRERATIEKEYSARLKDLCKRHFDKKAKVSASLSVGDEPQITPGSLESASLVLWNEVLTQTEAIAEEKASLAREISVKVCDNLGTLKARSGNIAKQIGTIHEFLESEKKKTEDDVAKAKKSYDSLCSSTESARQKTEKSSSDKAQRKLAEKEAEMNIGKNEYLMRISVANRLKDKYYYQDIPEILDYFQDLNESRVTLLNKILKNASIIERNSNDKVKEKLFAIDGVIDQNDPKLDVAMFIKHNIIDWKEPADHYFVPCDIWHDDEQLVTKEPELTTLRKVLNQASNEYARYEDSCLAVKQSLEEATVQRNEDKANLTLKFDTKMSNSLSMLSKFMRDDTHRVKNEVIIEMIQNFAGEKDLSYHEQAKVKKSRFGLFKGKKPEATDDSDSQSIHTVKSGQSQRTIGSHAGMFNLRRNKTKTSISTGLDANMTVGKALYKYDATGDDEASVDVGTQFNVVDEDDGSGWTMVRLASGVEGLVPTAYIEIDRSSGKKSAPPPVAPKKGAKRVQYVEALFPYQADGEDELSINVGDKIVLVQDDTDGSGWTEGELNGQKGLFPSSYVKKI